MQMLVDKILLSMPEMNRGPGYHIYHRTCLHLKRTKRVGQMEQAILNRGVEELSKSGGDKSSLGKKWLGHVPPVHP